MHLFFPHPPCEISIHQSINKHATKLSLKSRGCVCQQAVRQVLWHQNSSNKRGNSVFYNNYSLIECCVCMCMCVCMFFTLTDRASTIPNSIIYVVANPVVVRGLLDRKRSEEYLQSSNEIMKKKKKRQKDRNNNTKHMSEKNKHEGHSIERAWYTASRDLSHPIRNY